MRATSAGKRALGWVLILVLSGWSGVAAQTGDSSGRFSAQEMDQMLAPVALYPDSLLAQILMAATYPVEVVEADRWLKSNRNVKGTRLNAALEERNWDLSVKALVPFPQVLAVMSDRLDWMQRLGDAFLAQEDEVMDCIQHLRSRAFAQGNLKDSRERKVIVKRQVIRLEPAEPRVIYVPVYHPTMVYGVWWYPSHPPYSFYPGGAKDIAGPLSYAPGVVVGPTWNSGWGAWNWGAHQITVNINRSFSILQSNTDGDRIQTSRWQHEVAHRKGVPYRSEDLRKRYGGAERDGQAGRREFRGFEQGGKDDPVRKEGGRSSRLRGDAPELEDKAPAGGKVLSGADRKGGQEGRSAGIFQGIGRGDDAERFGERGRSSRSLAGMGKVGAGRPPHDSGERTFASPEDAVRTLAAAMKANDSKELLALFGATGRSLIFSGVEAADRAGRERFVKAFEEINQLEKRDENRLILHIGSEDWPLPVPLVRQDHRWFFSSREGWDEMLSRQMGRNELNVIQVCLGIVDAQREYASEDRNGDGVLEYARQLLSDSGKRNGLYWPVAEGEDLSPLGPLVARAGQGEHASQPSTSEPVPYHGYFYRILAGQGKYAGGGERDYLVKGKMIGGFAVVAYPAEYGRSGIMTFMVNQDGTVYEKNLQADTGRTVRRIKSFDPDGSWKKVE